MSDSKQQQRAIKPRSVTLVLGGVRSGKSRYAQQLAEPAGSVTFLATATMPALHDGQHDEEMLAKIERHRAERPAHWQTVEEPLALATVILKAESEVVLVDCLTLFAANLQEYARQQTSNQPGEQASEPVTPHHPAVADLCSSLATTASSVILVSNEVGSGVVPAYASGRRFRDLVGEINQQVAAAADNVVLLIAGLPLLLKGELPR